MNICLASGSPRRLELLRALGHEVRVIKPDIQELTKTNSSNLASLALANARLKAEHVFEHQYLLDADFILGADTIVVLKDQIFGKARDSQEAEAILLSLSGQTHQVITGFFLINNEQKRESYVVSEVKFRELSLKEIKAYVRLGESLDKAGAYGIQGAGAALIHTIQGSVTNIIGLPVAEVLHEAKLFYARRKA